MLTIVCRHHRFVWVWQSCDLELFSLYIYMTFYFLLKRIKFPPFFFFDSLVSYFFLSIQIFYYAWKGLVGLVVAFVLLSKCQPPQKCTAVRWPCRLVVVTTGVVVPTLTLHIEWNLVLLLFAICYGTTARWPGVNVTFFLFFTFTPHRMWFSDEFSDVYYSFYLRPDT